MMEFLITCPWKFAKAKQQSCWFVIQQRTSENLLLAVELFLYSFFHNKKYMWEKKFAHAKLSEVFACVIQTKNFFPLA